MTSELSKIANAFRVLCGAGYTTASARTIGKIIFDHYDTLAHQVVGHSNINMLRSLCLYLPSHNSVAALENYIKIYLPVKGELHELKISRKKAIRLKTWYSAGNIIEYEDFKVIWEAVGHIDIETMQAILTEFRTKHNWRRNLRRALKWPSTEASYSLGRLLEAGWIPNGLLSSEGYHVGQHGEEAVVRKKVLDVVLVRDYETIKHHFEKAYIAQWGEPDSWIRLMKLAHTIASLCRNAKRSKFDYSIAIQEWEEDLAYLKKRYYDQWRRDEVEDEWPLTCSRKQVVDYSGSNTAWHSDT